MLLEFCTDNLLLWRGEGNEWRVLEILFIDQPIDILVRSWEEFSVDDSLPNMLECPRMRYLECLLFLVQESDNPSTSSYILRCYRSLRLFPFLSMWCWCFLSIDIVIVTQNLCFVLLKTFKSEHHAKSGCRKRSACCIARSGYFRISSQFAVRKSSASARQIVPKTLLLLCRGELPAAANDQCRDREDGVEVVVGPIGPEEIENVSVP